MENMLFLERLHLSKIRCLDEKELIFESTYILTQKYYTCIKQ